MGGSGEVFNFFWKNQCKITILGNFLIILWFWKILEFIKIFKKISLLFSTKIWMNSPYNEFPLQLHIPIIFLKFCPFSLKIFKQLKYNEKFMKKWYDQGSNFIAFFKNFDSFSDKFFFLKTP